MPTPEDEFFMSVVLTSDSDYLYLLYGRAKNDNFELMDLEMPENLVHSLMVNKNLKEAPPHEELQFLEKFYPKRRFEPSHIFKEDEMEEAELAEEGQIHFIHRIAFTQETSFQLMDSLGIGMVRQRIERAILEIEAASHNGEEDSRVAFDRVERLTRAKKRLDAVGVLLTDADNKRKSAQALLERIRKPKSDK